MQHFDRQRDTLAAADAEGDKAVGESVPAHRMDELGGIFRQVPAFGPRMVCTACGIIGAFARPNWQERAKQESPTGRQWH
jgi:hypothetical protein